MATPPLPDLIRTTAETRAPAVRDWLIKAGVDQSSVRARMGLLTHHLYEAAISNITQQDMIVAGSREGCINLAYTRFKRAESIVKHEFLDMFPPRMMRSRWTSPFLIARGDPQIILPDEPEPLRWGGYRLEFDINGRFASGNDVMRDGRTSLQYMNGERIILMDNFIKSADQIRREQIDERFDREHKISEAKARAQLEQRWQDAVIHAGHWVDERQMAARGFEIGNALNPQIDSAAQATKRAMDRQKRAISQQLEARALSAGSAFGGLMGASQAVPNSWGQGWPGVERAKVADQVWTPPPVGPISEHERKQVEGVLTVDFHRANGFRPEKIYWVKGPAHFTAIKHIFRHKTMMPMERAEVSKIRTLFDKAEAYDYRYLVIQERAIEQHWEGERLSNREGPAVVYPDGTEFYRIDGIQVSRRIMNGWVSISDIKDQPNMEIRAIMTERYIAKHGGELFVKRMNGIKLHESKTGILWGILNRSIPPTWGLTKADEDHIIWVHPDKHPSEHANEWRDERGASGLLTMRDGAERPAKVPAQVDYTMAEVVNKSPEPDGSYKTYYLKTPPTARTIEEAVAWTFGMTAEEYQLSAET